MTIRMPHRVLAGDVITSVGPTAPPSPIVGTAWLNTAAVSPATNILYGPNGEILLHTGGAGGVGRYTRLAGPQEDVHLRSGDAVGSYAFVESQSGSFVTSNAYWDGTNWQRYDTAQAASGIGATGGVYYFWSAPAGANPLVWNVSQLSPAQVAALPILLSPPQCRAESSVQQLIPATTFTPLSFNGVNYNTAGAVGGALPWSAAAPTKMFARRPGTHVMGGGCQHLTSTSGTIRRVCMAINGTQRGPSVHVPPIGGGNSVDMFASLEYRLSAGDYVEVMAYNDVVGGLSVAGGVGWLRWVSD